MNRHPFVDWFCRNVAFLSLGSKRYGSPWALWLHFPFFTVRVMPHYRGSKRLTAHLNTGICGSWYRRRKIQKLASELRAAS